VPLVAPPAIPDDRAAALRAAFAAMVVDPAFIADVRKANVELSPIDGAAIAALVAKSATTPKDVIRRYNSLIAAPR
jgi:tripartite-type tricarboxylate transporter receptor subunit TctC